MRSHGLIIVLCTLLSACMVGPDFHSPAAPQASHYTHTVLPNKTAGTPDLAKGGKPQYFVEGKNIPAQWWYLFHSPELNALVQQGLDNSPNVAAAKSALRVAEETLNAQVGTSLYPAVNAQYAVQRNHASTAAINGVTSGNTFNLFNPALTVSYTLDMFGGLRREIQSLQSQVDYQRYQLDAAYLTLSSNIVTTAITVASLRAQIAATHELIRIQQKQLEILRGQFSVGGVSLANVLNQEAILAQTQATLPPLEQSLAQQHHALAVLVGVLPSELPTPTFDLNQLVLPAKLPVSLPSNLVRQRPDILSSEALLAAASAQIGVATANLLPQLTLSANYGYINTSTGGLFTANNNVWNVGGTLLQPVFNGGALRAKRRGAIASYEQAAAQYRQTVLQAFQNVADTLRALQHDAQTLQRQRAAEVASRRSVYLTQQQLRLGGTTYVALLTADQQYQQAVIARIQAQAARYTDTAALFQALGGGWWNTVGGEHGSTH